MNLTADAPVVHTLSGLAYRPEQDSDHGPVCHRPGCHDPLPDPDVAPVEYDRDGYAWHEECYVEAGMRELEEADAVHTPKRSKDKPWICELCGHHVRNLVHGRTYTDKQKGRRTGAAPVTLPAMPDAPADVTGERVETSDLVEGDRVVTTAQVGADFGIPLVRPHYGKPSDGQPVVRTVHSVLREAGGHVVRFDGNQAKSEGVRGTTRWVRV